jgi:predicted TIM-barrel enzyme
LADRGLTTEARDLTERGLVDAIIVSGDYTGDATRPEDIDLVRQHTNLPILVGSGATPDNLPHVYAQVDGLIVGSYFKKEGKAENLVEEARVKKFTDALQVLRHASCQ